MFKYYIRNLLYITEHKRNVFIEGRKLGLGIIQLLKHDLSKFSKWEFKPYTARFFDKNCKHCMHFYDKNQVSLKKHEIYAKECSAFKRPNNHKIEKDFELAWHHHQQNNKHHWQYWVSNKNGNSIVQEMPLKYLKEMLADWNAMSRKFHGKNNILKSSEEFFNKSKNTLLHPKTKEIVLNYFATGTVCNF